MLISCENYQAGSNDMRSKSRTIKINGAEALEDDIQGHPAKKRKSEGLPPYGEAAVEKPTTRSDKRRQHPR
ncbi:hypothetical protein T265_00889 [Opisthorchis viverrini]|uniref:Uncharacterized protein n=1 Tax=Opisthorchis viverrini TaxID=6198 RepID=A0A075A1I3_OPIVI|nr:hypothetical protein T265_00889 [Opisthorchis viverrini]KER33191.1 hypothetical protein T265_00889 [Opisthorchis viverrini]